MARRFLIIAALVVASPAVAAELPKSGSFKTPSSFVPSEEATTQVGDRHSLAHGLSRGVIVADNPLHVTTAMCPYITETTGDTVVLNGRCAWSDRDGDRIFTEWTGKGSLAAGSQAGSQTITGGSGKFKGIQGSNPFQCQMIGKEGQLTCTQSWTYQLGSK